MAAGMWTQATRGHRITTRLPSTTNATNAACTVTSPSASHRYSIQGPHGRVPRPRKENCRKERETTRSAEPDRRAYADRGDRKGDVCVALRAGPRPRQQGRHARFVRGIRITECFAHETLFHAQLEQ